VLIMRSLRARNWLAAAALVSCACAPAKASEFVLVNLSGETIYQLYISPCSGQHWGPNQLEGARVLSSRSFNVSNIVPGCYDVMVVLPPWNDCIMSGVALRPGAGWAWTITPSTVLQASFGDCAMTAGIASSGRRPWLPNER
jgi:hypothetical protein